MRLVGRVLAVIAITVLAYLAAGVVGGMIPSNAGWTPPERGVELFVEDNGVHTGIVMPKVAAGVDWRDGFPARDLADPRYAGWSHVSVGWGERAFYLETPTWAEVKPATILAAAFGSDRVLLHVDHVPRPRASASVRRLVVRPAEYRRLTAYIRATRHGDERVRGYAAYDAFYGARGRYSAVRTCNAWVGDALRYAGVRIGAWTPFPEGVMRWFPAGQSKG